MDGVYISGVTKRRYIYKTWPVMTMRLHDIVPGFDKEERDEN